MPPTLALGGTIASPGVTLTAGQACITEMPVTVRYCRLIVINGTTASTALIASLDLLTL